MNKSLIITIGLVLTVITGFALFTHLHPTKEMYHDRLAAIAKEVNRSGASWKAGVNSKWINSDIEGVKAHMGAYLNYEDSGVTLETVSTEAKNIPASFDSREQWGAACPSLFEVRDQSTCGSCWAFGAAEAMTDRHCIKTGENIRLSAQNMVSCCTQCGDGCQGGFPGVAMKYYATVGLVTGDLYGNNGWCQAYLMAPCAHHTTSDIYPPCVGTLPTPACSNSCDSDSTYPTSYSQDLHKGSKAYNVIGSVKTIQTDIMTNGPVEVAFTVYEDFLTYKSGVYHHVKGKELGGHAVKMIGWGVENNIPYWLIVNSWNTSWGENGLFKIKRGCNECGLEDQVYAALP